MTAVQRIVGLTGLSGSGKTTLIHNAATHIDFCYLSASNLIREGRQTNEDRHGDRKVSPLDLRFESIDENQRYLIEGFMKSSSATAKHIVFDCHVLIDTPSGVELISPQIFEEIGIMEFCILIVDPLELFERRARDLGRVRPDRTVEEIIQQQELALQTVNRTACLLGVEVVILQRDPIRELVNFLKTLPTMT